MHHLEGAEEGAEAVLGTSTAQIPPIGREPQPTFLASIQAASNWKENPSVTLK